MRQQLEREIVTERDTAEALALVALGFLAQDPSRLGRFLAVSGIGPNDLRQKAGETETLAAVLDYILSDETQLLVFTSAKGLDPRAIAPAAAALRGGGHDAWP